MSHRIAQVESTLKRAISQILASKIADPRIVGLISITKVTVSPDMHDAFVYVSVLPEKHQKRTLYGLQHATGHIFSLLKKAVALKTVPVLEFRLDDSIKRQAQVDQAIRRAGERGPRRTPGDESVEPSEKD